MYQLMMKNSLGTAALLALCCLVSGSVVAADGFLMTPRGTAYQDLKTGTGETAEPGDVVTMHFVGWLDDAGRQGKELYNSRRDGKSVSFVVGTDKVMQGWSDGVIGMKPGGKRLLRLPPALGYGARGAQDVVPADAGLMFMIDLIAVEK
ncbi:MAG: FKBP-type peptidyl-prolyl cis-trans isomerase [Thiogranum sp.]